MSDTLKKLLASLLLVALGSAALDWQDNAARLQQEAETSKRLRQRLENQTRTADWSVLAEQALQAQNAWLDRLVEVETTGVFRAVAMERLAELCKSIDVPCQVGAVGEKVLSNPQDKPKPILANVPDSAKTNPTLLPGLVSATVRLTFPVNSPGLHKLLTEIETGPILRSIDKFTVRAGRVEILVQSYGIFKTAAAKLRHPQSQAQNHKEVQP
jgi:hypothetical protein